jgi:hypothetical protein
MPLRRIASVYVVLLICQCWPHQSLACGPVAEPAIIARFTVPTDGDAILLPVELKGKQYPFLLDTGASHILYDSSLRSILGEPMCEVESATPDGSRKIPVFLAPDARLGKMSLPIDSPVASEELGPIRNAVGSDIRGVIGMAFLGKHVFRIDPDCGEMALLSSVGPDPGTRLPVSIDDGVPWVRVVIDGLDGAQDFIVDTGCGLSSGTLMEATWEALERAGRLKNAGETVAVTISQKSVKRWAQLDMIRLGSSVHRDLVFNKGRNNVLGLNFLLRYIVTFDLPHGALYLKKSRRFRAPDLVDESGLYIQRVGARVLIDLVASGSPGALAGLRKGDVIISVGEEKAAAMRLHALRMLLCRGGQRVDLCVQRGAEQKHVSLVLGDWRRHGTTQR